MNWKDCYKALIEGREYFDEGFTRFDAPPGGLGFFNCEEGLTISDFGGAVAWAFTYPGDWLLTNSALGRFLEYEPPIIGATASSVLMWFIILCFFGWLSDRRY